MSVKKSRGFVLILLTLILFSMMFVSASWFGDIFGKITGNSITGNAVLANSQCESGKLTTVNTTIRGTEYANYNISIRNNNVSVLVCNSSTTAIVNGSMIVDCPVGARNSFCVRSNTSSSSRVCTSYGWLGGCKSYATRYSYKIAVYGVNVSGVTSSGSSSVNCTQRCAVNGTGLNIPIVTGVPAECEIGKVCNGNVNVSSNGTSGVFGYDIIWTYNYNDGRNETFCACNGTEVVSGNRVRVNSANAITSIPIFINNSTHVISNVEVKVFTFKELNRSDGVVISNGGKIDVVYACTNYCYLLGNKTAVPDQQNKYRECNRISGTSCFNWSEIQTCSEGNIFNGIACVNSGVSSSCNGANFFCNETGTSIWQASIREDKSCAVSGLSCFRCDNGYSFNSSQKSCVRAQCTINCTGICSSSQNSVDNAAVNGSLDCCNQNSCFVCNTGFHLFNGSCISNNCSGVKPSGVGVFLGANITTTGAINWTYSPAVVSLGACQWKCNESGYKLNISNNVSCVEGIADCVSEIGGICSASALTGGINLIGNCSIGSCYVCNGSANYVSNGTACVQSLTSTCGGCIIQRNNVNRCVGSDSNVIVRVNVGNNKFFCNASSHNLVPLMAINSSCQANAQCESNFCGSGKCLDIISEVRRTSRLYNRVLCWFTRGFNTGDAYTQCLSEKGITLVAGE